MANNKRDSQVKDSILDNDDEALLERDDDEDDRFETHQSGLITNMEDHFLEIMDNE